MGQIIHITPINDLIEHIEVDDMCPCGPSTECVPSNTGDGWLITHHSLDGRELSEQ